MKSKKDSNWYNFVCFGPNIVTINAKRLFYMLLYFYIQTFSENSIFW